MTTIVIEVQTQLGNPRAVVKVEVRRDVLVAHLAAHHRTITTGRRATRRLVEAHKLAHYRTATATKHRHTPLLDPSRPSGPSNRPVGWYTGEGCITREEDHQAFLATHRHGQED